MGISTVIMVQAINPFENKDKETGSPVVQAVNPFKTEQPHGFEFTQEKEGGGIRDTLRGVKDSLFKDSEYFHEKGILRQVISKEVLGPSSLIDAGKKLGKDLVTYPAETLEAVTRGFYAGAVEPIIETGVRIAIPGEPPIQKKIVEILRKPAELPEYSFLTKKRFPETADELRQGFEIGGILAPFTAAESLAVRILPRLPVLATRGIGWIGAGQILHKPEEGTRAERAMWDIALLGAFELVGAAVRPMFRALSPKTSGTVANLAAGEKVTVGEAEGAAKEITERFAMEQKGAARGTPQAVSPDLEPLAQEARKFKSVEEFVGNPAVKREIIRTPGNSLTHGTSLKNARGILDDGRIKAIPAEGQPPAVSFSRQKDASFWATSQVKFIFDEPSLTRNIGKPKPFSLLEGKGIGEAESRLLRDVPIEGNLRAIEINSDRMFESFRNPPGITPRPSPENIRFVNEIKSIAEKKGIKIIDVSKEGLTDFYNQAVGAEARGAVRGAEPNVKKMTDDLIAGRDMVATEEKIVARDLIESYNKQFPNKRFPLEDIPGAARRLDGVENIGAAKIERLQRIKETLVKPFIEGDLQDLKQLITELRQELSAAIPKAIKRKGRELSFIATNEQIVASLSNARTMARNELKETILSLEARLARLASGEAEVTAQTVERAVGPRPAKDMTRILQEARRKLDPKLLVKDKIVKLDQEILKTTNEISQKSKMLQGILDSAQIAEKRIKGKFPQMYDYQNYLKEQIKLQTLPPKINRADIDWQPNTIGYNNPYTKQAYKLWNKVNELWGKKMPRILKTAKSREVADLARERQRIIDALVSKHKEDIIKLVEKMSFAERTKIGLMINKYIPIEEGYAPLIKDIDLAIGKLGNAIVELNQQWVKDGFLPANAAFLTEETWFRNLGQYTRSFYTDAVAPTGEAIAVGTGKVQAFVNRGQFKKKLTLKEWGERSLEFEGKTKAEILGMSAKDVEVAGLKAKQEYGWIYEADAVLEKTFKDSINNYTVMQWQDAIVRDPMLFSKVEAPGFVPVKNFLRPGVERDVRLGPLQDGWVHPGLSEELTFFARNPRNAASIIFGEALSWWKVEKVAMGPAVFRNYLSGGFIQTDMAGFPVWTFKNAKTYVDSTISKTGYIRKGERYKFWRDQGLFGSDYFEVEISKEMERSIRTSTNPGSELGKHLEKLSEEGKDAFRYYGAIDHMHRMYLAEAAIKNGATAKQSVHFANKWQLDYRIVPQAIDIARRGIGGYLFPFVSFYTLMLPRIAETLVTRPWVLLKYPIIAKSMEYVAMKKLGLTPDQVENGKPEFMKDQPYSVLLPWTDNQGNPQYFGMSYTVPFGSWETGFIDWAQYMEMGKTGGAFGVVRGLIENRDPFTEKPIWTDADAALGKKANKIAVYLIRGVGPAATPHFMNIYGAATGDIIGFPFQRPRSMSQSLLRAVGLSTYSGGFNEASWKISELEQQINQINFALGKVIQDPTVGEKEKNSITEQAIESINELSLQISEITRGMPPAPGELNRKKKEGSRDQPLKAINPFSGTE